MDLRNGIKQSCNVYFYELGKKIGIEPIAAMARRFGLGSITGLEIPGEKAGLVPDTKWKRMTFEESWFPGETLNTSIGQGYLQVSPVQMAAMAARLANGVEAVTPRIIKAVGSELIKPEKPKLLGLNPMHLELVRDGMFGVVNEWKGTARGSKIAEKGFDFSGKTGTVQTRKITQAERDEGLKKSHEKPWKERDHGWFVGYGPSKNPRYAIAVLVEHGGGGSKAAAPVARDIMLEVLKKDPAGQPGYQPQIVDNAGPSRERT